MIFRLYKPIFFILLFALTACLSSNTTEDLLRGEWQRITTNDGSETVETLVFGSAQNGLKISKTTTKDNKMSALEEMTYSLSNNKVILKLKDSSEVKFSFSESEDKLLPDDSGHAFLKVSEDISKYY
ncbi:hypothetical protein Q2T40_12670 [Winogradskyella maritima]|uniref:Lipocalin-like protein n=1 Tax=Winogradskyella maritima TaxID=1517766 RepID=A0ABV8AH27_9FLAO|nr:hypothetical protein [Winogradskyella maritima]